MKLIKYPVILIACISVASLEGSNVKEAEYKSRTQSIEKHRDMISKQRIELDRLREIRAKARYIERENASESITRLDTRNKMY